MAEKTKGPPFLGQRHLQVLLLFLAIVVNYVGKLNAGVAVVAMTNAEKTNPNFPEYNWNEMERSYVLSSFFWGYFITQFPGGYLCRRFGIKLTMLISTLGNSICILLPPIFVNWGGWQVYCGIRIVQGAFQGLLFPGIHAYLAVWCPVNERNRLGAIANTGIECGTLTAMFLSGLIAASSLGWPGIFYVSGGIGIVWCILWLIFAANSPLESKMISQNELDYIEGSKNETKKAAGAEQEHKLPVPWRALIKSMPLWALLVARTSESWGLSTLQAQIPSYMTGVLEMDMKNNALFSALPFFAMWCMSYVFIIAADLLLSRNKISLTAIRKTFNSLAFWVPALGLIAIGFLGVKQKTLAIVIMTASVGINSGATIGSALNTIDLSPNHAGILMGIVNTSANIVPILSPLLVGLIVKNEHDSSQWQIVFIISAVVFAFGNLFYIVFGSMELQPWNDEHFLREKHLPNEESLTVRKSFEQRNSK